MKLSSNQSLGIKYIFVFDNRVTTFFYFQLVDICMLDISSLNYSNSVIAASALYHKSSSNVVLSVSGRVLFWCNPDLMCF